MSIIPTKEENKDDEIIYMKNITIDLEFENTIYYNNNIFILYNKKNNTDTKTLTCDKTEEPIQTNNVICYFEEAESFAGEFGIKYTDECGISNYDTKADIIITDLVQQQAFISDNKVLFFKTNEEQNITITLKLLPEYENISKKAFYFENGDKNNCTETKENECTVDTNNKKVTFPYTIPKDSKRLLIYFNNRKFQNDTIYIVRY